MNRVEIYIYKVLLYCTCSEAVIAARLNEHHLSTILVHHHIIIITIFTKQGILTTLHSTPDNRLHKLVSHLQEPCQPLAGPATHSHARESIP